MYVYTVCVEYKRRGYVIETNPRRLNAPLSSQTGREVTITIS